MKCIFPIVLLFVFIGQSFGQISNCDWKFVAKDDNITTYTCKAEGSAIKRVKMLAEYKVDFATLILHLNDVPHYPDWVFKCYESRLVKKSSETDFFYYMKTDLPFPLTDRDMVIHSSQWYTDDDLVFHAHALAADGLVEEDEDLVRITFFESDWTITDNQNGTVSIEYYVASDPGGYLPAWLVNLAITKGPLKNMQQLEEYVMKMSDN